jgi:hypothetical protein
MIDTRKLALASPAEFTAEARRLWSQATSRSETICGDEAVLRRWMNVAKSRRMTWVEGLAFAIDRMNSGDVEEIGV